MKKIRRKLNTFECWKEDAIAYLRTLEKKANVKEGEWNFVLGGDDDMKEQGYFDTEYFNDPEGYVDYQIECAQ